MQKLLSIACILTKHFRAFGFIDDSSQPINKRRWEKKKQMYMKIQEIFQKPRAQQQL
jgi:hypothetical protein